MKDRVDQLNKEWDGLSAEEVLAAAQTEFSGKLTLASSLGAEDQVLTDMMATFGSDADVFVLDTGRLNKETHDVLAASKAKYDVNYRVFTPNAERVEAYVNEHGKDAFYDSIERRKECCNIRKVIPLSEALSGYSAWITGIRRAQSVTRMGTPLVEWDEGHQMIKINPLYLWSKKNVWDYLRDGDVPYNALHDLGYASIGCEPCTRAVKSGEDERAGRWWWEAPEQKECGLHVSNIKKGN